MQPLPDGVDASRPDVGSDPTPSGNPGLDDTMPFESGARVTQCYGAGVSVPKPESADSGLLTGRKPSGGLSGRLLRDRLRKRFFGREHQGTFIGRYQLVDTLGAGGMGVVFTALDRELQRQVALKVVHEHLVDTPRYRRRMLREAQAMARLSHPNVVHVYEVGEHEDQVFIAMELVSGATMRQWLDREHRGWRAVIDKFIEAGRGLAAAHGVGLVHRDFKPDNILVGDDGRVRVTDFGVAQIEPLVPSTGAGSTTGEPVEIDSDEVTKAGAIVGTASYMSPEQLGGEPLDARSDLFGFCIALYEGLYGERPFAGENLPQLVCNITQGKTRPAPEHTDVPPGIRRILMRGLEVDPSDRYPGVDSILAELEDELAGVLGRRMRGPGPSPAQVEALRDAGYELRHAIRDDAQVVWLRAVQQATGRPVMLKLLRDARPSASARARLRAEHERLAAIDHPGVISTEGLVACGEGHAMVLGAPDGVSMRSLIGSPLCRDLGWVLGIARSLADALQAVHMAGFVHGGLHPEALVVDLRALWVVIADLDAAGNCGEVLEPAVPRYAAPEQREGTRGPADPRTDHFGLGVVLYELLTGQLPFHDSSVGTSESTRVPSAPHVLRDDVPVVLSQLVLRLLDEDPDARYQSTRGLRADLDRCARALREHGHIPAFELGTEDVSNRFHIPERLYGREVEQEQLWTALRRVQGGGGELVLVAGPSGIGKTALVADLEVHVADEGGRIITGKFDQVGSDVPYESLVQAFTGLFERLAIEPPKARDRWRARLHEALGNNLGVIAAVIPGVRSLVGPTPPVQAVPPAEAAHRFRDSFRTLLSVLARPEHPLVVFLDDLQWSDASTLRLVASLAADTGLSHVLWVGTYRDNEVDDAHPLVAAVQMIEDAGARVSRIDLDPLALEPLGELIAQTLSAPAAQVATLAQLIFAKSEGNPFFARALLQSLHQQHLVVFDPALERWGWDVAAIDTAQVSDDVVELMTATLVRLPAATQQVLRLAACVGNVFDLDTVAHVAQQSEAAVAQALREGTTRGLVRAFEGTRHAFAHDRIQQAAYAGLDESERTQVHLAIGRRLSQVHGSAGEWVFTIANHLHAGLPWVTSEDERARIAQQQIEAGRCAKAANAYAEAVWYFRQALGLQPADAWTGPGFDTCFELHKELMEVEYLGQNPEGSAALFEPLMTHARTDEQRAEIYELRAALESSMGHHAVAMDLAARGLKILGVRMPVRASRIRVVLELVRVKRLLRGRSAPQLDELPEVRDPRTLLTMRLLIVYSTSGYFVDSTLLSVGMLRITRLTLRDGVTDASAFGFAGFAMVLAGALDQFESAAEFGQLALRLNKRFGNVSIDAKLEMINGMFLLPWVRPFPEVRAQLDRAREAGQHNGDLAYASYAATTCATVHALEGVPLDATVDMTIERLPGVRRTLDEDMASIVIAVRRMSLCFQGQTLAPPSFSSADWSEPEYVARLSDQHTPLAMYYYRLAKLVTSYHFRSMQGIAQLIAELHPRLDSAFGNPTLVDVYFYECLASARRYEEAGMWERRRLARAMRADLRRLSRWADSCPASYQARHRLARAEYERVVRGVDPMPMYTQAIRAASEAEAHHLEGLGYELAAEHAVSLGHELSVTPYVDRACAAYERWGASAKIDFLRERFSSFGTPMLPEAPEAGA